MIDFYQPAMLAPTTDIPRLTTADLWKQYVLGGDRQAPTLHPTVEDFYVTRLENFRQALRLPTQPHRRDVNELVFVTSGRLVRGCNLSTIQMEPGSVHLLLAGQIASVNYLSDDVAGFYCHFSLDTIIRLYHREHMVRELDVLHTAMADRAITLPNKISLAVTSVFERLLDEHTSSNDLSLIDAYLVTLCYEIKNALPVAGAKPRPGRAYELTERLRQLISQHTGCHLPLTVYADQLGVSPNHLNKAVREVTGQPASTLITEARLLEAKVLLRHSDQPVGEIAFRLGFNDQSYFSRFFRKATGLTPQEFRKKD
ncbi:helix-turn-helix transcriptional regulator [Fibrisoma limi]|nr:AraC family transcriptional regulator [Fibrisoma limi]